MSKGFDGKLFDKLMNYERSIDKLFQLNFDGARRHNELMGRVDFLREAIYKVAKKQKSLVKDVNRLYLWVSGATLVGVYAYKEQSRINAKFNRKIEELKRDVNALYAAQPDVGSCYPKVDEYGYTKEVVQEDGIGFKKDGLDGSRDDPFSRILNGEFGENSAQK